jgi:hypothetical protein
MAKLKLGAIEDDKPVKLTIELPAAVHRDLVAAEALARERCRRVSNRPDSSRRCWRVSWPPTAPSRRRAAQRKRAEAPQASRSRSRPAPSAKPSATNHGTGGVIGLGDNLAPRPREKSHYSGSPTNCCKGRPVMKFSATLDTATARTTICVMASKDGRIVFETTVPTDPRAIFGALQHYLPKLERVGHEAGSVSPWS